jgi:2-amino-4-hydroxy-6-hydroxymethyldihydropteridine diphosphokinase
MTVCYLGLGSNQGDRKRLIRRALENINALPGTRVLKVSSMIETRPVGGPPGQGLYLNACAKVSTSLSCRTLLNSLKKIERTLGRIPCSVRNAPRPIDIDILLFGGLTLKSRLLTIPHPRMFSRDFVLRPLREVIW